MQGFAQFGAGEIPEQHLDAGMGDALDRDQRLAGDAVGVRQAILVS